MGKKVSETILVLDSSEDEKENDTDSIELNSNLGKCCLAKWKDTKYYAGKIADAKKDNNRGKNGQNNGPLKYTVQFEDGGLAKVNENQVVIGDYDSYPCLNQEVTVAIPNETKFEQFLLGIVIEIIDNMFQILTDEGSHSVSPRDIFLTEKQMKQLKTSNPYYLCPNDIHLEGTNGSPRRKRSRSISQVISSSPQPCCSNSIMNGRKSRTRRRCTEKNSLKLAPDLVSKSDCSSESEVEESANNFNSLESEEGVQPELQLTQRELDINRLSLTSSYIGNVDDLYQILGKFPVDSSEYFKNETFLITCTVPLSTKKKIRSQGIFSDLPFDREHLEKQIKMAGGTVYQHFELVPKRRYKKCKLIAPYACTTAKYVQCLAAGIPCISHEYIFECCEQSRAVDLNLYLLPSGYSLTKEKFMQCKPGPDENQRKQMQPFKGTTILIGSFNDDYVKFWSRVSKLGGALVRTIKSDEDISSSLKGLMLTQPDFPESIKSKADFFNIPSVSTNWVVECLIVGDIVEHNAHPKLTQTFQEDL